MPVVLLASITEAVIAMRRSPLRYLLRPALFALCFACWASSSFAAFGKIDFDANSVHVGTPSFSYAGGATPLVGSSISLDTVTGIGTLINASVGRTLFDPTGSIIRDAQLNFTTGNFTGTSGSSTLFGAGGSINITGSVDLNNNNVIDGGDIINQVLASGTMSSSTVLTTTGNFRILVGGSLAYLNSQLLAYYGYTGIQVDPLVGAMNFTFSVPTGTLAGQAFTSTSVLSGDVAFDVDPDAFVVPETSTIYFCSIAAAGVVLALWRSRRSAS
jgi:hypothetical protein